jgi:spermidine synthase
MPVNTKRRKLIVPIDGMLANIFRDTPVLPPPGATANTANSLFDNRILRKLDQGSVQGKAVSSYPKIITSTAQLLAVTASFLGIYALFQLFYSRLGLDHTVAVCAAAISMLMTGAALSKLAGDRLSALLKRQVMAVETWMDACSAEVASWSDNASPQMLRASLITAAGLSLFLELVLIRWEASLFVVFALYKNFTLLACFCGLGVGYAKARDKQQNLAGSLPMVLLLLLTFNLLRYGTGELGNTLFQVIPVREEASVLVINDLHVGLGSFVRDALPVYGLLTLTFVLNVLVLLPVGQFCGHLMRRMEPLTGYGYNLLGSIAGVALLFVLSWAWAGPAIWFGLAAAALALFQLPSRAARKMAFGSAIACTLVAAWPMTPMIQTIYSPYQIIEKAAQRNGLMILLASGSYYQRVFDLSPSNPAREMDSSVRHIIGYYELPFKTARSVEHVAIVGAGSGNDVAAALRNKASHVDAVEIDPVIRDLGAENHPEHPYLDPRVHSIINDARNFLRTADTSYDAIVYGVLDSHTVVSHGANMRVDSFVYTKEGLRDAFDHLKTGGLLSVSFALPTTLMGEKIFHILNALPGAGRTVAILTGYDSNNTTTFMVSKAAEVQLPYAFMKQHGLTDITPKYMATAAKQLDIPTDDWPFFYLEKKMYPATYLILLVIVLGIAFVLIRSLLPSQAWRPSALSFFFLGGGFMLVETKAITELGVLFGNTWQVVGVTIISVLVMACLANAFAARLIRQVLNLAYLGLFAALVIGYVVAIHGSIAAPSLPLKILLISILMCPLFFSGIVFSTLLKDTKDIASAMSYNLMGAMLGGALEYNSMRLGFSSLYLIALALYGLAWVTEHFRSIPLSWLQIAVESSESNQEKPIGISPLIQANKQK